MTAVSGMLVVVGRSATQLKIASIDAKGSSIKALEDPGEQLATGSLAFSNLQKLNLGSSLMRDTGL